MKYGPNSEQVEVFLQQVAELDGDDWASLALVLMDSPGPSGAAVEAIAKARSRAKKHGLLREVDAAARAAHETMGSILDASTGLREVIDRTLIGVGSNHPVLSAPLQGASVTALRTAATSGAVLLVLRPLLDDGEFTEAWTMPIIDPRNLPQHVCFPFIGATGA
jgi:hypothetical protein